MISAAFLVAAAVPAQTPVSPQQYAYSAWGQCLESQLAPDRYMTAPRITDRAMQACMRFEQDYNRAHAAWMAAANLNPAQTAEAEREYNRTIRRMRRMIEDEVQEIQDQSGNR
jgi:hypothetical protein